MNEEEPCLCHHSIDVRKLFGIPIWVKENRFVCKKHYKEEENNK